MPNYVRKSHTWMCPEFEDKNDFIILSKKVCLNVSTTYSGSYLCFGKQRMWILKMLMAYVCFVTLTYPSGCWYIWDCLFKVIEFFFYYCPSFFRLQNFKRWPVNFCWNFHWWYIMIIYLSFFFSFFQNILGPFPVPSQTNILHYVTETWRAWATKLSGMIYHLIEICFTVLLHL